MVAQVPAQQPANPSVAIPSGPSSSSVNILMADSIDLTTQAKSYDKQLEGESSTHTDPPSIPQFNGPLTLEKPTFDASSHSSKGALRHTTQNLNSRVAQHYNIVEDLSQASCTMLALEVLQIYPAQRKDLLTTIRAIDSTDANLLFFDPDNSEPHLPHTIALHISVSCLGKSVHCTVLDEGVATYIMSYSC